MIRVFISRLQIVVPLALFALLGAFVFQSCDSADAAKEAPERAKVLYVTHEPGRYHDYTAQRTIFEKIAAEQPWEVTVMSADHDGLIEKIKADPDFGAEADVIIYNICMAKTEELDVPHHILRQTEEHGKPALLIHCALHSFWATYKEEASNGAVPTPGAHEKAHTKPELIKAWNVSHPGVRYPAWPNMTGIASTKHGPKRGVESIKAIADHPIVADVDEYTSVDGSELYNNFIDEDDAGSSTTSILLGKQGDEEYTILWEKQHPKAKVVSYTMGHSTEEWEEEPFQKIIANSVNYLISEGGVE